MQYSQFLQTNWLADNDCYIKFQYIIVQMICDIDEQYKD